MAAKVVVVLEPSAQEAIRKSLMQQGISMETNPVSATKWINSLIRIGVAAEFQIVKDRGGQIRNGER